MTQLTDNDPINSEILKLFPLWRHDGLAPLTTIIGYTSLLLDSKDENLTERQKQFITMIRNVALKASMAWHSPGDYITLRSDLANIEWKWESVPLSEICDQILSNSFKYINKSNVRVDVPDTLAPVRADRRWLSTAITNLLEPSVGYFYNPEFRSRISAQKEGDKYLLVNIATGLELSMDDNYNSIESISSPGSSLSVANMILNKHGSRLKFRNLKKDNAEYKSEGTEFMFMLPIWQ